MTVLAGTGAPPPPPGGDRLVWRESGHGSVAFRCGHLHSPSGGRLDEAARRLSHEEYGVAQLLALEGHDVRSLPESRRGGRRPDLLVCGSLVEVKSFAPVGERRRDPTPQSVYNKLVDASGQAPHVVLVGAGSGLTAATVRRGLARYAAGRPPVAPLSSVRAIGDGYDLGWSRRPGVQLRRPPHQPGRAPERGLGP